MLHLEEERKRYSFILTLCLCLSRCPLMVYMSNDEEGSLREDKLKKRKTSLSFLLDKVPHIITALKTGLPIQQNELKPSLTEFKKNM